MTYNEYVNKFNIYYNESVYKLRKGNMQVHHIIPKFEGGKDSDGLIVVTPKEHEELHRLYAIEHKNNKKAQVAYNGIKNLNKSDVALENSSLQKGNTYSRDRKVHYHWYTNGTDSKMFTEEDHPHDWVKGRSHCTAWNKGKTNIYKEETILKIKIARKRQKNVNPYGTKGKHWYTDGYKSMLSFSCPSGFFKGRTIN